MQLVSRILELVRTHFAAFGGDGQSPQDLTISNFSLAAFLYLVNINTHVENSKTRRMTGLLH
jgi:hypothetical protein